MRKILKIARLELSILFYSPVAWLVLAIFMIQCGITFLGILQDTRTTLSLGYQTMPITSSLFAGNSGLFTQMTGYIYLYLPILTMGLMSRETSSGSIKLLLSSPVKLRQIILGKYLAIIGYGLTLIFVLMIFGVIGALFVKNVDLGLICSGMLALYLLICTYAAIGLFMSCLTTYQVVAAISTLAVFAIMRYVGTLWQAIDFVRDLTYFMSISGRTEKMVNGMITTKDIFYYLIIIASFLSLCVLRLKSERELKPFTVKVGRYVALVCIALGLGYITSRPVFTGYLDTTDLKSLTITKNSQAIAAKIHGELKVTTYVNMLDPDLWNVLPESRNADLARLEPFKRFIPGMDVNYVYYYQKPVDSNFRYYRYNPSLKGITDVDKIAEKTASTIDANSDIFLKPAEVAKQIDLQPEGYLLVRKLEYKGKSTFLRFYPNDPNGPYASEAEVSAALKRLLVKAPKIIFLTGNNERGIDSKVDRDYQQVSSVKIRRKSFVNQGFDVDTVDINQKDIPAGTDIVVLADPTTPLSQVAQQRLNAYIAGGGDMMITGEPGRQQILNPIVMQFGVQLKPGILIKQDKNTTPGFLNAQISAKATDIDSNVTRLQKNGIKVTMQGASAVETIFKGRYNIEPLLVSPADGWNKVFAGRTEKEAEQPVVVKKAPVKPKPTNKASVVSAASSAASAGSSAVSGNAAAAPVAMASATVSVGDEGVYIPKVHSAGSTKLGSIDLTTADLSFNAAEGDQKGAFPISVAINREINGKQQRIVVSGDADFVSNGELSRDRSKFNEYYLQGLFRWFSNNQFPVDVTRPPARDMDIKISRGQITGLMWICKGIIPALIAILGAITLLRRRRN